MPRQSRVWLEHCYYHIISRGNHRNDIFRDAADFGTYLDLLKFSLTYFEKTPYELNCYCLMDNHVHLLVKCSTQAPGYFMSKVNWHYARYFNKKYDYMGHLFQERYFSELISNEGQLLRTSRYIHLNPVRAGMVPSPDVYVYSSYRNFIGLETHPIIQSHSILQYFTEHPHEKYRDFVMRDLCGDSHPNISN